MYLLVLDQLHPEVFDCVPSEQDTEVVPQASVAVAVPHPGTDVGLHPKLEPGGQKVMVGAVTSTIQVNT